MRLKKLAICCVSAVLICASMIMRTDCVHANAVDKLTIKLGYFGWQPSEYVEKAVFPASDLYDMGTVTSDYTYWDGGSRVAIDSSLGVPLSINDTIDVWKKNSMANALMITPFAVTGALKNTYELNEYDRAVNPYKAVVRDYDQAVKEGRWDDARRMKAENPELGQKKRIEQLMKTVGFTKKWIDKVEKSGKTPDDDLLRKFQLQQQAVVDAIREARKQ